MTAPDALGGTIAIGNDLIVKRFGYGAMRITGPGIWGPPADRSAAVALIRHVADAGVTFIDTADSYGPNVSEEIIAEALYPYAPQMVIATKAGFVRTGPDRWTVDAHPDRLRDCVHGSLRRLKRECIDLMQLHRIDPQVPIEESLGALTDLQTAGKIRHIGISEVSVDEYRRARHAAQIVSVQNLYNVEDRSAEAVLVACEADGVVFLPWFPLGGKGCLQQPVMTRIAAAHEATTAQIALGWLLARSPAIIAMPGTSSARHFDDNLAATTIVLTADERAALDGR